MATQVGNDQTIDVTAATIPSGSAVEAGSVKWASSDEAIATITQDAGNELRAVIAPLAGATGTVTITLTGDADVGAGVETITGTGELEVIAGQATGFTLAFGNPVNNP